jgi:membrane protein YqaA with SNARE-associated domain
MTPRAADSLTATDRPPARSAWLNLARLALLVGVIVLSVFIFTVRDQAARWAAYGYPGIFVVSILANATVLLPAPGIAIVFAMGSVFSPWAVALAAGLGAAIGEVSGYAAGLGSRGVVEHAGLYAQISGWMQRYGPLTTLVLAAVPNPFFDLAGMAAGALRMPLRSFFFWCLVGKIIKMLLFAYTGAYSIGWLADTLR